MAQKPTESNSSKVFKSMHSQTLVTVILGVLELVYFSVMSRLLSQTEFGFFALITAVTAVLTSLTDAGLGSSIIQKKNPDKNFISTAYGLSIISGLFFSIILFFGAPLFSDMMLDNQELTMAFRIMSIMLMVQGIYNVQNAFFIKNLNFLKLGLIRGAVYFVSSAVGIIMALYNYGFYAIVWAQVANQSLFCIILLWFTRKENLLPKITRIYIKPIVSFGGWLTGTVIIRNITDQLDKLIVARLLNVTIVGAINRPNGFVSTITSKITGIFDTILYPILSSIQDNPKSITSAYEKSHSLIVVFTSILSGVIVIGSIYIIDIFFGPEWENIQPLLWIFGFSIIFSGLSRIQDCFFRSLGKMKAYFVARLSNCILAIGLIVGGCFLGMIGVGFAILLRNVGNVIIKYFMLKPYIGNSNKQFFKEIGRNIWFAVLIELIFFLWIFWVPEARYYAIFIFIALIGITAIFLPKLYGQLFYNQIASRYFSPIYKRLNIILK